MAEAGVGELSGVGDSDPRTSETVGVGLSRLEKSCSALAQCLALGNSEGAASAASFLAKRRASLRFSPAPTSPVLPECTEEVVGEQAVASLSPRSDAGKVKDVVDVPSNADGSSFLIRKRPQGVGVGCGAGDRIERDVSGGELQHSGAPTAAVNVTELPPKQSLPTDPEGPIVSIVSEGPASQVTAVPQVVRFPDGADVEYFSQSMGGWVVAVVQNYDEYTGTYCLDIHPQALPQKVRAPSRVGAGSASSSGKGVAVVSARVSSSEKSSRGTAPAAAAVSAKLPPAHAKVGEAKASTAAAAAPQIDSRPRDGRPQFHRTLIVAPAGGVSAAGRSLVSAPESVASATECGSAWAAVEEIAPAGAGPVDAVDPAGKPAPAFSAAGRQYAVGAAVEYFSTTHGGWVPAKMEGYNENNGSFKLDIQPMALPSKVRAAVSSGAGVGAPAAVL
eukprot:TRINITY_DN5127_c0_g1_i2.p1 TRINITY_DN5127_c0_g1~~TRINITY_DN5127_c0_g1_i2.p1  ORF type:complete len:447 (+),score=64.89 TRINITY_DN5127_c0_g1_i2:91-1431(+)